MVVENQLLILELKQKSGLLSNLVPIFSKFIAFLGFHQ